MAKFTKRKVSYDRYRNCIRNQIYNGTFFSEHVHGSSRKIIINKKVRVTLGREGSLYFGDNITDSEFVAFIAMFNKQLYKQFQNNDYLYYLDVKFRGSSKKKNFKLYSQLPEGTTFYNVDLKSAYWQIAYQLGYLKKETFEKYFLNDKYKQAKRLCISFLARKNKMIYYNGNDINEIHCDITALNKVYKNIRNQLYKCITDVVSLCSNCIEYNIDGVSVLEEDINIVRYAFMSLGLKYKITKCTKLNQTEYIHNYTTKKFKHSKV